MKQQISIDSISDHSNSIMVMAIVLFILWLNNTGKWSRLSDLFSGITTNIDPNLIPPYDPTISPANGVTLKPISGPIGKK